MLVENMDADLTPEFIRLMKYKSAEVNLYNSIKYKNAIEAHYAIAHNASSMEIDFTKVFDCATGLWEID